MLWFGMYKGRMIMPSRIQKKSIFQYFQRNMDSVFLKFSKCFQVQYSSIVVHYWISFEREYMIYFITENYKRDFSLLICLFMFLWIIQWIKGCALCIFLYCKILKEKLGSNRLYELILKIGITNIWWKRILI